MKQEELSWLQQEWVRSARDSDLGLWWLAADVREELGSGATGEAVRRRTLELLGPLLRTGVLVAVDLLSDGHFTRWEGAASHHFQRIEEAWRALGRDPKIGEIAWFIGKRGG